MLNDEDKKYVFNEYLRCIHHISNKEYQIRAWILGEIGSDFDETVNLFFDIGEPILKEYKGYGISEEQYQLLKKFRDTFEAFPYKFHLPQEFINTSEWKTIMAMAKGVLKAFNYT
jgi:hypothetical protein